MKEDKITEIMNYLTRDKVMIFLGITLIINVYLTGIKLIHPFIVSIQGFIYFILTMYWTWVSDENIHEDAIKRKKVGK